MKGIALAGLAVFVLGVDAATACVVPYIPWANRINDGTMTVASGKPCKIYFRSLGPTPDVQIVQRAAHGRVSIGSVNTVIYQSRPGFVGNDTFAYARRGLNSRNRPVNVTMRIAVTVTP